MNDPFRGLQSSGLGGRVTPIDWHRLGHFIAEQGDGSCEDLSKPHAALTDHEAVANYGNGVGSVALGNFIECFADYAKGRVLSTGALQYEGENGVQRFESLTSEQLYDELLDELADTMAYIAMVGIRVLKQRSDLQEGA